MHKNSIVKKSILIATGFLLVPILGNQLVDGWNWEWHDFIFGWLFWVVMISAILFVNRRFSNYAPVPGILMFMGFATLWGILATG